MKCDQPLEKRGTDLESSSVANAESLAQLIKAKPNRMSTIPQKDPAFDAIGGWTQATVKEQRAKFREDCGASRPWPPRIDNGLEFLERRRLYRAAPHLKSPLVNKGGTGKEMPFFYTE